MEKIQTLHELDKIVQEPGLTVVKFFGEWCQPCKMLTRTIEEISPTLENVHFYEVDVDEAETELLEKFAVQSVPVLIFFNDGLQVDRVLGARGKAELLGIIEKNK